MEMLARMMLKARWMLLIIMTASLAGCGSDSDDPTTGVSAPVDDGGGNPNGQSGSVPIVPGSDTAPVPAGFIPDISQITEDPALNRAAADVPGSGFYTSHTAAGVITGPVLGTGEYANSETERSIAFQIGEQQAGLSVEQVYAVRDEAFSAVHVGVILVVRNSSDKSPSVILAVLHSINATLDKETS